MRKHRLPEPPQRDAVRGVDPKISGSRNRTGTAEGKPVRAKQPPPAVPKCFGRFDSNTFQCMRRCKHWHRCIMHKWTTADFSRIIVLTRGIRNI